MQKKKLKAKQILLAESHEEMIGQLRQRLSHFSDAETIRYCISFAYGKTFKDYVEARRQGSSVLMTPEMKAKHDIIRKDARKSAVQALSKEEGTRICNLLEGTIVGDSCSWVNHSLMAGGV